MKNTNNQLLDYRAKGLGLAVC